LIKTENAVACHILACLACSRS